MAEKLGQNSALAGDFSMPKFGSQEQISKYSTWVSIYINTYMYIYIYIYMYLYQQYHDILSTHL
jgi:hypothetical protein